MKRDAAGGGTNADGTRSELFCSHCYEAGKFKQANMTVTEMQALVKSKLRAMGFPGFLAGLFTRGIPKLQRWNPASH